MFEIGKNRPDLFDIRAHNFSGGSPDKESFVTLPGHCRWSALLDVEGRGYSGRRKYLFYSNRPLLIVDDQWREFWQDGLRPMVHYVPVRSDLGDLVEKAELLLNNEPLRREIAENALAYARNNITRESAYR